MPPQILLLLAIIAVMLILFMGEWLPTDVVALGGVVAMVLTGLLPVDLAFRGFGSDTFVLILGLLVLTAALAQTGIVEAIGRVLFRRTGTGSGRLLILSTLPVAVVSSFISNTATTALFLPVTVAMAARAKISPSTLLLPVAFASILASSVTLVATSTNIVVSGLLTQYRLAPLGMFELTIVGVPIALLGLAYLWGIGRRLLPSPRVPADLMEEFGMRGYLSELTIRSGSRLVGKTLAESGLGRDYDLMVLSITRSDGARVTARSDTKLQADDIVLVEGDRKNILKIQDAAGIDIRGDLEGTVPGAQSSHLRLAEVILLPDSPLIGRTIRGMQFRERFGLQVLAVHHRGGTVHHRLNRLRLTLGDVLLVQGDRESLAALDAMDTFSVLGEVAPRRLNIRRAPIAIAAFAGAIVLGAAGIVPLSVAVVGGAVIALGARAITPAEAYQHVEWKLLVFVGSILAVGAAMERTGTASFLAARIQS